MTKLRPLRLTALLFLALIGAAAIYIAGGEVATYVARSPAAAEEDARKAFVRICDREGFDQSSFNGPIREDLSPLSVYRFVWMDKKEKEATITIDISYMPYDLNYYLSEKTELLRTRPKAHAKP